MGKGMAEGCAACAKWLLIIFNVIFCLLGVGLIAAGVYSYIQLREYFDFFGNENINAPGIVLIVFGAITFIIAAIGCIGACKESSCLLFAFAGIIGVLLIAELVSGIVAFVFRNELKDEIKKKAELLMQNYSPGNENEGTRATWDLVQRNLECCGVNGPQDWLNSTLSPKQSTIPESCNDSAGGDYTYGCVDAAYNFGVANILIVGGIGIGFAVVQLIGIVLACCVACAARKGQYA